MPLPIEQMPQRHAKPATGPVKDLDRPRKPRIGHSQCRIVVHQALPLNPGQHQRQSMLQPRRVAQPLQPPPHRPQPPQRMNRRRTAREQPRPRNRHRSLTHPVQVSTPYPSPGCVPHRQSPRPPRRSHLITNFLQNLLILDCTAGGPTPPPLTFRLAARRNTDGFSPNSVE